MRIDGPRLYLTELHLENLRTHYHWNNDPELNRLDSEVPFRRESFGDFARRFERMVLHPPPNARDFEIHRSDGTLIGVAYLAGLSPIHRHGQVGITIGERSAWGRGYGGEALELLLAYGFGELGLHRVTAEAFAYNDAWRGLLHQAGFTREGCLRDYLFRDGAYWDKETYSLLDVEYGARSKAA